MMKLVEIDIGKPHHEEGHNDNDGWLCSSVILPPYKDILSYNDVSYWFNLDQYNIGGRIAKNSPEGKQLVRIIKDQTAPSYMEKTILGWCFRRMSPGQLTKILDWVRDEAFKEGKNAVRKSLAAMMEIEY